MRIIAGALGGLQFNAPKGHKTHPMSDRARGALFNILGDLDGLTVLDAFAGSGALSFEAVSRGAVSAHAIDLDKNAQKVIEDNIKSLKLDGIVKLINASANAWLNTNPDAHFDIVLCDPPYNDLQLSLLTRLAQRVKDDGLFVLSWPNGQQLPGFDKLTLVEQRAYGDLSLAFYRRKE